MLKDILVYMNVGPRRQRYLSFAIQLARQFDARLIGLLPAELPPVVDFVDAPAALEIVERHLEEARQRAVEIQAEFEQAAHREGIAAGWRREDGEAVSLLVRDGRCTDMIVLPQEDGAGRSGPRLAGEVALAAGRPIRVVPSAGRFQRIGERVLVAWNGSREATRAVHDALPILRAAAEVTVLSVDPPDTKSHIPGADIGTHLAAHGVRATARHLVVPDIEVGDVLLNTVAEDGTDLLVMGAYGRSRLRELVLGGVTRDILAHMTVPVLMSH